MFISELPETIDFLFENMIVLTSFV
jgi:hypothetical protein